MRINVTGAFGVLVVLSLALLSGIGWVLNIVKLAGIVSDPITGMFVLRVIGVLLAPLGAVLGFI